MSISIDVLKDRNEQQKLAMRRTRSGRLLVRYGYEPYDTESAARRVAEKAADEIHLLKQGIRHALKYGTNLPGCSQKFLKEILKKTSR